MVEELSLSLHYLLYGLWLCFKSAPEGVSEIFLYIEEVGHDIVQKDSSPPFLNLVLNRLFQLVKCKVHFDLFKTWMTFSYALGKVDKGSLCEAILQAHDSLRIISEFRYDTSELETLRTFLASYSA